MEYDVMRQRLIDFYQRSLAMHAEVNQLSHDVQAHARSQHDPGMLADAALVLKKGVEYVDGARKEVNRCLDQVQRIACLVAASRGTTEIEGQLCRASPDTTQAMAIPDHETQREAYLELMEALDVPRDVAERDTVRPSFKAVEELVTRLGQEGRPMPRGLEHATMIPRYRLTCRVKKGVNI